MSTQRKVLFWLAVLAAFTVVLVLLRSVLLPFVAGMALAYFLDPAVDWLQARKLPRALAATVVLAAFLLLAGASMLLFLPLIEYQIAGFARALPGVFQAASDGFGKLTDRVSDHLDADRLEAVDAVLSEAQRAFARWAPSLAKVLYESGGALLNLAGLLIITPVVAWYLLRDWDLLVARVDGLLPRDYAPVIREQMREIDKRLAGFVRGQAVVCLILGAAYAAALHVAGLNYGIIVGLVSGLISFIPFVGSLVGLFLSLGFGYLQFGATSYLAVLGVVFIAGQAVEGYFLTPKLVGERIGLHPVWVVFALMAGGALFGFVGVLIAMPAAAVVGVLMQFAIDRYRSSRMFRGRDGMS